MKNLYLYNEPANIKFIYAINSETFDNTESWEENEPNADKVMVASAKGKNTKSMLDALGDAWDKINIWPWPAWKAFQQHIDKAVKWPTVNEKRRKELEERTWIKIKS